MYEHKKPKSMKDTADADWPMSGPIERRSNAKTTRLSHAAGRNQRDEKIGTTGFSTRPRESLLRIFFLRVDP
jgi:hypothetical protein